MINLAEAKDFAILLARKAGKLLLRNAHRVQVVERKDARDICTDIDLEIETVLVDAILEKYPDHGVLSEEKGQVNEESPFQWILDPIDGTKHFIANIPLFTVSIALECNGELVLGVVYDPSTKYLYHAHRGGGAFLNNKPLSVSSVKKLDQAVMYLDISKIHTLSDAATKKALKNIGMFLMQMYRARSLGVGSLGMCYLAHGAYDVFFDLTGKTKYVDIAAGVVIVQEAGGLVFDINGSPISRKTKHFFGSNKFLKKQFLDLLTS